jgi:enamine deaminase RidA (YjgF/YER057c/UK114 family)
MIEHIDTGQRMSKIVKHNSVVYLCGQVGDGPTVTEQTADCLARIEALLEKAGSSPDRILQAIIWLADMADVNGGAILGHGSDGIVLSRAA